MENKKNNKVLIILLVLFVILTLLFGGYIVYDKFKPNNNTDNNNSNKGTVLENIEIKNYEVKELYKYIEASIRGYNICAGYFYQNPFKNHELNDKIAIVLRNYGREYEKNIDNNFLQKINESDRNDIQLWTSQYIDANIIKQGMKKIFNINVDNFSTDENYGTYSYRSDADAFLIGNGGGNYQANVVQQIIDYTESNNEISITTVKAEINYNNNNVYRYVNNQNTLVYENISSNDFKFTKENIVKFPQIKYIFKKNEDGNYYVNNIENLNFEEDFEVCN